MRTILNSSLWRKFQQSSESHPLSPSLALFPSSFGVLLTLAQQCYALLSIIKIQGNFSSKEDGLSISAASMMRGNAAPSHSMPQHTTIGHCKASQEEGFHHCCLCDQKNAALLPLQCHTPHATTVIEICVLNRFLHILAANQRHCKSSQGRWGFHLHCHLYAVLPFHATHQMPPLPLKDVALTDSTTTSLNPI